MALWNAWENFSVSNSPIRKKTKNSCQGWGNPSQNPNLTPAQTIYCVLHSIEPPERPPVEEGRCCLCGHRVKFSAGFIGDTQHSTHPFVPLIPTLFRTAMGQNQSGLPGPGGPGDGKDKKDKKDEPTQALTPPLELFVTVQCLAAVRISKFDSILLQSGLGVTGRSRHLQTGNPANQASQLNPKLLLPFTGWNLG